MNLSEYQQKARETAIYLGIPYTTMIYPALGLMGECGEVTEKVKKLIRDDNWHITKKRSDAIKKGLSDCCWYLANICCDTDLDLEMMYQMRGSSIVHRLRSFTIYQLVIFLNVNASSVANKLSEWYYSYECRLNEYQRFIEIPTNISNIITCIETIANRLDTQLHEILDINLAKLRIRKENKTLHGSGDNR
ncbi:MAG: nucleoside triphosphate pyrophosphohydrolase family protein [Candidatus Heimdallarchaeota archaeon]|nr:MAG: nucleoside triphosphate pyrophosphohydrolase family protein [Candidatus Heimdallarchaeota archaeon]